MVKKLQESMETQAGLCHNLVFQDLEELDVINNPKYTLLVNNILDEHKDALEDQMSIGA